MFITPHLAGALSIEVQRLGAAVLDEIERYVEGRPPANARALGRARAPRMMSDQRAPRGVIAMWIRYLSAR